MNGIRRWISNFIRNNRDKIEKVVKLLLIVALVIGAVILIFSNLKFPEPKEKNLNVYKPSETVISGSNVDENEFEEQNNLVKEFVDYCNNGELENAYELITDECKEKLYPTLSSFRRNYYNVIFENGSKEYNLKSWVNSDGYSTYRVRFVEDIISTGNYDDTVKFEDYITIVTKDDERKLNINGYVKTINSSKKTTTDEVEAEIIQKDIYMDSIEYTIKIKNLTDNEILLDTLKSDASLVLIGSNNADYRLDKTNLKSTQLAINPGKKREIKLKFIKEYGSNVSDNFIRFKNAIMNYSEYLENKNDYDNYKEINIGL